MADWHGHARNDYLRGDDAETSPTRSITIDRPAGRSQRRRHERAIVAAMKGPRRRKTKASALDRRRVSQPSWQAAGSRPRHEPPSPHRAPRRPAPVPPLRAKPRRRPETRAGDPRTAGRAESRWPCLLHRLGPDRATATRSRVLPRDRRGPLLTPGSALHPRRAQPGRHPGHHRADHLPGRLDRHHPAAGERHRAREAGQHGRLRRPGADQHLRV